MLIAELALLVLVAGAALLRAPGAGPAGGSAVVLAAVAIAGLRAAVVPRPPAFLAVTAALVLAALGLAIVAAVRADRSGSDRGRLTGPVLLLVGAIGLSAALVPTLAGAPPVVLVSALAGMAAAVGVLVAIGRWVRFPRDDRIPAPPGRERPAAGVILGSAAAALGPHFGVVVGGVVLAAWSGFLLNRRDGGSRVPVAPLLTLPLLAAWWLMATIAGPEGLGMATLPLVPLSPAAELMLAPVVLVAAWATAGLWPLHRQVPGGLLAVAGALLVTRVVVPAMPDGLEHWRALAMPLVVVGLWHAALSDRPAGLAVGMAWIGLLGGTPSGKRGAVLLLAAALVLELGRRDGRLRRSRTVWVLVAVAASLGGVLAVEAGLRTEVVYTVAGAAALVSALAGRQAMMASVRSTTEASG
jgi:hypothetical protein